MKPATKTLTGATRYRLVQRWFRQPVLALQVEILHEGEELTNMGNCVELSPYRFTTWEWARPDDLRRLKC